MFRPMRRHTQQLSREETIQILENNTSGVLALAGDDGYPYAVPMSYVYTNGKLFFHSALSGHKVDAVKRCEKASFCVIDEDEVLPERYTTAFRSVIAFGKVRLLEDDTEKRAALETLSQKYRPGHEAEQEKEIESGFSRLCMIEFAVEHITGKEGIELTKRRKEQ